MTDVPALRARILRILAGYALLGGGVSFLGWALDIPRLTDWDNDGISSQPNGTVAVAASGAALLFLSWGKRWAAALLGILVAFIGSGVLFQYFSGVDLPALKRC